jgi:site-specific DNA recombinase
MKAVIYARYSSDSQREESIEGQLRECTEYAERNGITILRSYIDRALSARTADRPEFQNMIKDSEQKLFDVVLIWKLDRFSRDRYDSAHYKRILKKNGVKVVSVKENISDGPEGIILESMLEGYAEYYSAELSEKIQRGQKENALKCKNNGGNTPLGYVVGTDGVLAVDPLTAPLVTEIFTRYDSGESISEITASLNGRGLKTKKGKAFKIGGISLILKNRKYIGEYQYGSVIIPKGIPAIIDDDLFDRVQRRMAFNKKAPAKAKATEEYLLTPKLFCGTCERLMAGESGTSSTKGVKHYYYKCGGAKRKLGCKRKAVRKHWIERAAVLVTVQRVLQDDEISRIAEAIVALQEKEDTSLPAMRQQLTECEKAIDNMLNAIQMGVLTASTKERLEKLEMQREELKLSILQAQMARPRYTKEQVVSWISRFKYGNVDDPQYQKQIIDTFINSIYVFDDKLVFTYNFKDGTETITLAEIQAAFGSDLTQVAPPRKNLGITMVPRFFLCLFLEEKSLFACGIWGYFRVISGLRVAKVLQIFWPSIRCATRVCSFLGRAVCCKLFRQLPCRMPAGPSQQFAAPNFYDYSGYKHSASCPSCCVQPNTESPLRPIQLQKDG